MTARTGINCSYCGVRFPRDRYDRGEWSHTVDHVVPRSAGGVATVPACLGCNNKKGSLSVSEFLAVHGAWLEDRRRRAVGRGAVCPMPVERLLAIEAAETLI